MITKVGPLFCGYGFKSFTDSEVDHDSEGETTDMYWSE
jgi:hypothetical protein